MAGTNGKGEYIRIADGHLEVRQKVGKGTLSGSGKNRTVVSTGGFKPIDGSDIRVNIIAITKA